MLLFCGPAEPAPPSPALRSRWGRWALLLVPALLFVGLLALALREVEGPPGHGDSAPGFTAAELGEARSVSLDDLSGRPVLLNFWASWCDPCRDEAPMLRRAEEAYGRSVTIVGIAIRDSQPEAIDFVERHGLDYLQLSDEDLTIYEDYGLTGQPESFLIDADGTIVEHVAGPFPSQDELFALLEQVAS